MSSVIAITAPLISFRTSLTALCTAQVHLGHFGVHGLDDDNGIID